VAADFDLGMSNLGAIGIIHAHEFCSAENLFVKVDSPGGVSHDKTWDQGIASVRNRLGVHDGIKNLSDDFVNS
jgi:hypothetical protein